MNNDRPDDAELLEAALNAISNCTAASDAADVLRSLLSEGQSLPAVAVLYGLSFVLVLEREGQLLSRPDFEPRHRSAAGDFPPPIAEWDEGLEDFLLAAASHPKASTFARAKLGHTLWRLRPGRATRQIAELALIAAIDLGSDSDVGVWERYRVLASALDLAHSLHATERRSLALSALLSAADSVIEPSDREGRGSGIAHDILQLFLANGGKNSDAAPRIEAAMIEFSHQPRGRTQLAVLLESTAKDNKSRKAIIAAELDRLIAEADDRVGLMKDQLLREAQQLALTRGLTDHIRAIGVRLARMDVGDFDLKERDVDITISGEDYRSILAPFAEGQPLDEALQSLVRLFPPFTPAAEPRKRSAAELIASPVQISSQGLVTHAPLSEDELKEYWERQDEDLLSQFYVAFLDAALQELVKRQDFMDLIFDLLNESDLLTQKGKERIRRAFMAYIENDWDVVLDTLPTIEAAIRELAKQQGALTINPAGRSETMANQQKLLGGLLDSLTTTVPSCRRLFRYWKFMLVDQLGWNIRNNYLHGLVEEGTRATAGIALHIIIHLLAPLR